MSHFKELYEFVDRAVKNRKYAENTGYGIKAALKLFEEQLHEDEKESVEKVAENVDSLYLTVYQKNGSKYGTDSLRVYKSRLMKVIKDFQEYGMDPAKMAAWTPPRTIHRARRRQKEDVVDSVGEQERALLPVDDMQRFEIPVGKEGKKAVIMLPREISVEDARRLKGYIDLSVIIQE